MLHSSQISFDLFIRHKHHNVPRSQPKERGHEAVDKGSTVKSLSKNKHIVLQKQENAFLTPYKKPLVLLL